MAENLGEAQLRLTVDLNAFRDSLKEARNLLSNELNNVSTGSGAGGSRRTSGNARQTVRRSLGGARENIRALEVAQERRFRLARRIDALEERGADVARLRTQLGRLTDTQIRRQFGSFRQVSQELARQVTLEERRLTTQRRQQRLARQQAAIGAQMGGARESINALEKAQDRRFRISQRINRLEERGVDVSSLRTRLGDLTTSYAKRQFGTARQLSRELERQVSLTEARARRERDVLRELERTARIKGPRESIRGRKDLPGSPLFLEEQRRREAKALRRSIANGGPTEPIGGRKDLVGSPAFKRQQQKEELRLSREQAKLERQRRIEAARLAREQAKAERDAARARRAEIQEGKRIGLLNTSPISGLTSGGVPIPNSPNAKGRALNLRTSWTKFLAQLEEVKREIEVASVEERKRLRGPALPISGRLVNGQVIPGSPADRRRQQRQQAPTDRQTDRFGEAIGSAIIGGAFPALFGQGVGASLFGAIGGLGGGAIGGQFGFGLSLVGTALGTQVDLAVQKLQTLGSALDDPIGQFGLLAESGLISSKGLQKQIEALISTGREAEAAALIQQDLAGTFGDLRTAQELATANDELNRSLARLQVSLGALTSGPLKNLIDLINSGLGQKFLASQLDNVRQTLDPERQAQLDSELRTAFGNRPRGLGRASSPLSQAEIELVDPQQLQALLNQYKEATDTSQQEAAQKRFTDLRKISFQLIEAEVQGNQRLTFELKKQQVELERRNKLDALGASAPQAAIDQVNLDAQRETARISQQQALFNRQQLVERLAGLNKVKTLQEQIQVASQRQALGSEGVEAANAIVRLRDSVRSAQQAQNAARLSPYDTSLSQQAQQASESVRLGFVEAKNALVDGLKQAKDQAREIARSIQDTALNLLEIRGTGQGLSRFLIGNARQQEQRASFLALLPQFFRAREAAARDAASRGNFAAAEQFRNLNFSGSTEAVNQAIVDFIKAQRTEERLQEELIRSNTDLVDVQRSVATYTEALSQVSSRLADLLPNVETAMSQLASKEWSVSVNVPGGSASGDVVGAVNSRL